MIGQWLISPMAFAATIPTPTPIAPPTVERTTDSMMNCDRIMNGVAPIAMRRPISLMRSVTLTSMMFMIPMPPTKSEIAATAVRSTVIRDETEPIVAMISFVSLTSKSSSW